MRSASNRRRRCIVAAVAAAWLLASGTGSAADAPAKPGGEVLIYRCTDAQGQLSLRDTPCAAGQRQQTMSMMRPVDPPPRPRDAAPPPSERAASAAPPQYLVVRTPQPMYDCVRPDGSRYVSDNGDGNPRMMPLVDLGYGVPYYEGTSLGRRIGAPEPRLGDPAGRIEPNVRIADSSSTRIAIGGRHGHVSYSNERGYVIPGGYNYGYGAYYGSQLVRDECHPLPQQEVCSRLRDQRWAGDRRYNSALQSERAQITTEQRGIDARLNADCGAY
ncbi:DUF4124 domain-containing protein [Lysobacter sp. K5869]|uniref:DUF4124 domain-containing protein n=1 Tax=Lysobacter sp. K5869 TaxID=2820808 RepID=UPI001C06365B|nr:DUF4124 domain-containing protein [Lysobacter sp. K5869]QWP77184.1 DUF4124 domain-containing protein [Lysobacter sp. K5869]